MSIDDLPDGVMNINDAIHGIWETQDKRQIPVEEMETSHIQACITDIKEGNFNYGWTRMYGGGWLRVLKDELARRGEL